MDGVFTFDVHGCAASCDSLVFILEDGDAVTQTSRRFLSNPARR
jgi:hypothetical protein